MNMRLDVFLKTSRLIKRRTLAKEYCDEGWVLVGGVPAKPGREMKEGDRITLDLPRRRLVAEVVVIPKGNVPKEQAVGLYHVIDDEVKKEEIF